MSDSGRNEQARRGEARRDKVVVVVEVEVGDTKGGRVGGDLEYKGE
jgi:hypothetical protein